jgi:hypothetical protein
MLIGICCPSSQELMMKTAGVVFDFYDDPSGRLLKESFPTAESLPEVIKTAHILRPEEHDVLRDEAFALVMTNDGKVLRKFACIDPGNTLLSHLYFEKTASQLPEEARKVAEQNIAAALSKFSMLKEAKEKPEDGRGRASGMSRTRDSMRQPLVGDEADWAARTNLVSVRGGADAGRVIPTANQMKTASEMAESKPSTNPSDTSSDWLKGFKGTTLFERAKGLEAKQIAHDLERNRREQAKAAKDARFSNESESLRLQKSQLDLERRMHGLGGQKTAMVDVSGKEATLQFVQKTASLHALGDKYPLDSYADIRAAVEFFSQSWPEFDPHERHEFCVKTAARAQAIGLEVSEQMLRYGSTEFAPDLDAHIANRKANVEPEFHEAYDALLEKKAEIEPEVFAELLTRADIASGLNWHWGGAVSDPYLATFGGQSETEKVAYSWEGNGVEVDAEQLQNLAGNRDLLMGSFEKDIVYAFQKDPVTIFESLPDDSKTVIARLAVGG